jgi:hypothetical protein
MIITHWSRVLHLIHIRLKVIYIKPDSDSLAVCPEQVIPHAGLMDRIWHEYCNTVKLSFCDLIPKIELPNRQGTAALDIREAYPQHDTEEPFNKQC